MLEWLLEPIDPSRAHEVGLVVSWHGRVMTFAWGAAAPLAVFIARFLKVLPGQDWPRELDSTVWWRCHWIGQSAVLVLTLAGVGLIVIGGPATDGGLHGLLGYSVLALVALQIASGVFRGTKGGPTAVAPDGSLRGDHYDMTRWRVAFELFHKSLGYFLLGLAAVTILLGLWRANAPVWMWAGLACWWTALGLSAATLQRRGWAVDTYQAIWGPDRRHPGNRGASRGWGMRRFESDADARSD